ncbi:MAG: hypothetical protein ED557_00990 [Balneola sp.]|nr:MAG: hypothetical protein ED557_00990 [Balneola sp.]
MEGLNWVSILFLLAGIPSLVILALSGSKTKELSTILFGAALASFLTGITVDLIYFEVERSRFRDWLELISIASVLCALFIKARNSKPIFARFPIQLTFLPYIVLFFFPMAVDTLVVKNLLQIIYQGGGIIVAILLFSINHYLYKKRELLLISSILFLAAYILFWIIPADISNVDLKLISNIVFTAGIISSSLGLKKLSEIKSKDLT